jgi:hypothetical protein
MAARSRAKADSDEGWKGNASKHGANLKRVPEYPERDCILFLTTH